MLKISPLTLILLGIVYIQTGCSGSDDFQKCDSSSAILLRDNICLLIEHNALSETHRNIIENKISSGVTMINNLMSINDLSIRIVDNPQYVIPEIGLGGFNPNENEVIIGINSSFNDLEGTLEENLIAQLAHEIHHANRRRSVGYGNTLLQGAVSEGLADHFSIEVTGISPPPWTIALAGTELQDWIDTASNSWNQPYNHSAWFLGSDPSIPRWTGYSIGFELVKNYLSDNPSRQPSDLHDEPADSFLP